MEHSESVATFAAAFVAAQAKIEDAVKAKENPHFRRRYADLGAVMDACKTALGEHGIAILQAPAPSDTGTLAIDTVLLHKSGEWVSGRTVIPLSKNDPQGFGSAMTYARRYSLAAMVGVCPEDDDAEAAMGRGNGRRREEPKGFQQDAAAMEQEMNARNGDKPKPASAAQVREIIALLNAVPLPEGTADKWLAKAGVDHWKYMDAKTLQNCIDFLKNKQQQPAGAGAN